MKNNCVIAKGWKNRGGYGSVRVNGKFWLAYRLAWYKVHRPIPEGLVIRHLCNNPACINVIHLAIGTQADNIRDKQQAERQSRGETHGKAKLTETQAREILAQKPSGRSPYGFVRDLAYRYGVNRESIRFIWTKHTWKHIHPE